MTDKEFLTQMVAMNRACMAMCRQYIVDNPDGAYEDDAEECYEECAGEAAMMELYLETMQGDEGVENSIRKQALAWKRTQT